MTGFLVLLRCSQIPAVPLRTSTSFSRPSLATAAIKSNLLRRGAQTNIVMSNASELTIGATVKTHSLASATEYNGSQGTLVKFIMEKGRWEVKISDEPKVLALKPENLELVNTPPGVPALDEEAATLLSQHGVQIAPLPVLGAEVSCAHVGACWAQSRGERRGKQRDREGEDNMIFNG